MSRVWMAFGIGEADAPPLQAAREQSAREGSGEVLQVCNLTRRAETGRDALPPVLFESCPLGVVAERPRAVKALLRFAGVPVDQGDIRWVRAVPSDLDRREVNRQSESPGQDPDWVPWYPVVDADRCTRCGQCVKFCLFSVYAASEDGLPEVIHPRNCKNLCPACARICPSAAIIFPRYTENPFNGEEVQEGDARLVQQREDLSRLLGDDPVAALQARQRTSRRLIDETRWEQALTERERHRSRESGGEGGA